MRVFVFLLALAMFASGQVSPARSPRHEGDARHADSASAEPSGPTAESLLQLAHDQAQEMPVPERAALLARAIGSAQRIQPKLVRTWTEELFALMPSVPDARRAGMESGAVVAVLGEDPDFALDLLERMDAPSSESLANGADLRMYATSAVFGRVWSRRDDDRDKTLERLRTVAAHLGATGVYPYGAFGPMMMETRAHKAALSDQMFSDLLQQFRASRGSYADISEFVRLLTMVHGVANDPAYREGLTMAVAAIDRLPVDSLPTVSFTMNSSAGPAKLDNAASLLLMRILPMLKQVDPAWAKQVLDQHADLSKVEQLRSTPMTAMWSLSPSGASSGDAQQRQLGMVRGMAENSPQSAVGIASRITDPGARAAANAEIAAGMASNDPAQAAAYLTEARQALETLDDPAQKVPVLTSLARAAYATGDLRSAAAYTDRGFTVAEEVVRADFDAHPDKPATSLKGVSDLGALVTTGMRLDPIGTTARINGIRYPLLRANLMLSAADALQQERRPGRGQWNRGERAGESSVQPDGSVMVVGATDGVVGGVVRGPAGGIVRSTPKRPPAPQQ